MLLAQGNVVYFGPTLKAIDYFGELGIHIKEFENPGDFLRNANSMKFLTFSGSHSSKFFRRREIRELCITART